MHYFDHRFTYEQVVQLSRRVAFALQNIGLQQGQSVGLVLPNIPQFVFAYFGVLIAGGESGIGFTIVASAELYDPAVATFAVTAGMTVARAVHTATLLGTGQVLIAGGYDSSPSAFASAEVYDASTGTFTATSGMRVTRYNHTARLLPNGLVLIAGGWKDDTQKNASAELYDPRAGKFTATGSMTVARDGHTATLLPSGRVLMVGGLGNSGGDREGLASAELYE